MRILLALFAAASAASASVPSDVMEFELGNGIRVISRQMPSTNEGLAVFLEGGSRTLDEGTAGIENLAFEACLMGSSRYPGEAWRSLMDVTQARIEGVYGYDFSALRLMCLEEDLPVLLDAMSDCLIDPELEASAFERTRDGLLQALLVEES
ncbi:MAG TPA: insulinase family protein, partial [Candidatus Fermentibacter sp.]|nr:insulinase family protein [Candidatus Fermentibacter sp.]